MLDVLVAGGGPVGLVAALHAHRAGLEVAVHEPRRGPLDKACGEGLMPGAVGALAALGVDPDGYPLHGIRYLRGVHRAEAGFPAGEGRGVRRTALHGALRAAVDAAAVPVVGRAVTSVVQRPGHVLVDGVPARYLLAADGLHSPTRRRLGLERPPRRPRRFGLRRHFLVAPWTHHVEVHWATGAEAYVTPVAEDLVGVALLTSRRGGFDDQLEGFPELRARLAGAAAGPVRGAGPLRQRTRRRVSGRVLLVGDAAGYVDALTGEGLAMGFGQARAAVAAVAADTPEAYERAWRRTTWRYEALTRALLGATSVPPLRRGLVPLAAAAPGWFAAVVDELARPVDGAYPADADRPPPTT